MFLPTLMILMICSMASLSIYCQQEPETSVLADTSADTTPQETTATENDIEENPTTTEAAVATEQETPAIDIPADQNVATGAKDFGPVENTEENTTPPEATEQSAEPVKQEVTEKTEPTAKNAELKPEAL